MAALNYGSSAVGGLRTRAASWYGGAAVRAAAYYGSPYYDGSVLWP